LKSRKCAASGCTVVLTLLLQSALQREREARVRSERPHARRRVLREAIHPPSSPAYAALNGRNSMPVLFSMIGSVFAYKCVRHRSQSRVRSCLQPILNVQSTQLRMNTEPQQAAMRTRHRTSLSIWTVSLQSQRRTTQSVRSLSRNIWPAMSPGTFVKVSPERLANV
jgi:hypothetical protein